MSSRRVALESLLEERGPKVLLELVKYAPNNIPASSLLFFLLNSSSPVDVIEKLGLCDSYLDSERRIEVRDEGKTHITVEHVSVNRRPMTVAEDLFICGFLTFLLTQVGCQELTVKWLSVPTDSLQSMLGRMGVTAAGVASHTCWRFQWKRFERPEQMQGLDEFFLSDISPAVNWKEKTLSQTVEIEIRSKLVVRPTIEPVAARLGISSRTLQRGLEREGTSFSRLCSEVRIRVAEESLCDLRLSITEIAHLAGYADSGHFTREFKRMRGVSPKDYRKTIVVVRKDSA